MNSAELPAIGHSGGTVCAAENALGPLMGNHAVIIRDIVECVAPGTKATSLAPDMVFSPPADVMGTGHTPEVAHATSVGVPSTVVFGGSMAKTVTRVPGRYDSLGGRRVRIYHRFSAFITATHASPVGMDWRPTTGLLLTLANGMPFRRLDVEPGAPRGYRLLDLPLPSPSKERATRSLSTRSVGPRLPQRDRIETSPNTVRCASSASITLDWPRSLKRSNVTIDTSRSAAVFSMKADRVSAGPRPGSSSHRLIT